MSGLVQRSRPVEKLLYTVGLELLLLGDRDRIDFLAERSIVSESFELLGAWTLFDGDDGCVDTLG